MPINTILKEDDPVKLFKFLPCPEFIPRKFENRLKSFFTEKDHPKKKFFETPINKIECTHE